MSFPKIEPSPQLSGMEGTSIYFAENLISSSFAKNEVVDEYVLSMKCRTLGL